MEASLRSKLVERLRHKLGEVAPWASKVAPAPTSELDVYELVSAAQIRVFAGVKIAARTDRFFGIIAWSPGEYPIDESAGIPCATLGQLHGDPMIVGRLPRRGAMRLDLFAGRPMKNYDVNISAFGKEEPEYRRWIERTQKHPTWQEIVEPRLLKYTDEVAYDIAGAACSFATLVQQVPLARQGQI